MEADFGGLPDPDFSGEHGLPEFRVAMAQVQGLYADRNVLRARANQALDVLRSWPFPLVAQLRDSQAYVVLTGLGKSLFDYHSAQVRDHQADWDPLLAWLDRH